MEEGRIYYFCHICQSNLFCRQNVQPRLCPYCSNEFIEIVEADDDPNIFYGLPSMSQISSIPLGSDGLSNFLNGVNSQNPANLFENLGLDEIFNPMDGRLDNLINIAMQNDPNRWGSPPASEEAVAKLTETTGVEVKTESCSICLEPYKPEDKLKIMPCKHNFHSNCLVSWLRSHNSCPICRHELKTDDEDYEKYKQERLSSFYRS